MEGGVSGLGWTRDVAMNSRFCERGEEPHVWNQMLWLGLHVTVGSRRVEESLVF